MGKIYVASRPKYLTASQMRFIEVMVTGAKQGEACEAAGVSHSTGSLWMKDERVVAEIDRRLKIAFEAAQVTPDRIVAELAKVGFANQADIVSFDENGQPLYDFSTVTRDQMAAIEAIEVEEFVVGRGDMARDVRKVRVKHHSKTVALTTLAKIQNMLVERREHAGPNGGPIPVAHAHRHVVDVRALNEDDRAALEGVLSRIEAGGTDGGDVRNDETNQGNDDQGSNEDDEAEDPC